MLLELFDHEPRTGRTATAFKDLALAWRKKMTPANQNMYGDHRVRTAADPVLGLRGRKAPSSMGKVSTLEVLRLRATGAVSRDKSVMALRSG